MSGKIEENGIKSRLSGLCLVEVSGAGCASCLTLFPVLKAIAEQRGDIRFVSIETDGMSEDTADLIEEWGIDRVPTVLLTDEGVPFARCFGYQPEEILEIWIDAKISEHATKSI
ncbi:MAG: thioredoxin family protein [Clostridia bacterium]|nr:thioredoxin family protein [Clostridia bacterium]